MDLLGVCVSFRPAIGKEKGRAENGSRGGSLCWEEEEFECGCGNGAFEERGVHGGGGGGGGDRSHIGVLQAMGKGELKRLRCTTQ